MGGNLAEEITKWAVEKLLICPPVEMSGSADIFSPTSGQKAAVD